MARVAPAPGQAPLPAADAAALLRRNGRDPTTAVRTAIRFDDDVWTHGDLLTEAQRWARLLRAHQPSADEAERGPARGTHVGVLLDNTPNYLFALAGAALAGAVVVGLNPTRVGEHLLRDLVHTDVDLIVTEPGHLDDLAGLDLGARPVLVSHRFEGDDRGHRRHGDADLEAVLATGGSDDPGGGGGDGPGPDTTWALVFTSGTSGAPKAVICSQRRLMVTGSRMASIMGLGPDDVGYVAMPLFHSNALMVGWAPALVLGASVGLARRFSVSGFLPDVRRYGATWFSYTGKPLSYLLASPERNDDADNPLRVAFGNEGSPRVISEFGRRFGLEVIDAFGSTEGAIAVDRSAPTRPGAVGRAGEHLRIVGDLGEECSTADLDAEGRLLNAAEAVGEIVSTGGRGPFEGYYNNPAATERATRQGWYWSGDLGYLDADRYLYFAGRTAEWIRVDGENFPAGPIAEAVAGHPDVVVAVAYGVPDAEAGDQVMAALVLRPGCAFDPDGFAGWLDNEAGIGPKWRPRYVRVADELPSTGTNKVITRTLAAERFRLDRVGDDEVWVRERGDDAYRRFGSDDEADLRRAFAAAGRDRFWDL